VDVGERWYPDILAEIREEQARAKGNGKGVGEVKPEGRAVEAH
jgi:hypothetical protein